MDFSIFELVQTVLIISGISTVLALLMVIADATIGNYGDMTVTINNEKVLTVPGGRPLLGTLKDEGLFVPSACGGRGSCGLCKVKVTDGGGEYLATELPWISPEEQAEGVRLSCQLKVKRNMKIEVPPELFSVKEFRGKVSKIVDLTHDIKEINIELTEPNAIEYKGGQFIQLEIPEYALTDDPVYRAYSMSSDCQNVNSIQLEIRYVPNGISTTFVHNHLKEGDEITFNGPHGEFFLRDSEREVVCVAGGSGMAPIKSILHHMAANKIDRNTMYFFGARAKQDLFLLDEMAEFEKILPNFKFIPALSQPDEADEWDGETGWITETLAKHLTNGPNTEAYLCGSPFMIEATVKVLLEKGVQEDRIFYDKF